MAASQEQKVDFLLKKIGYTASKTGIAEDETGISGTKKAPFAEPIPSPLTLPGANVWAQSNQIPTTPPGATTSIVRVYKTGTAQKLTFDSTVAGNRSFVSRETPGEVTSTVVGDWVDTQFGSDYIVKVYKGDPNSGGVQLSAAGSGSNDTWFFDYSAGVLNFNGTNVPAGISTDNIFIEGYRYTGIKGVTGVAQTFTDLEISGITTFNGAVDMNSTLDVDGDTQLDDLNVSGVATFSGNIDANGTLDVDGQTSLDDVLVTGFTTFFPTGGTKFLTTIEAENGMFVHNAGISTFKTPVQIDAGATLNQLNVTGVTTSLGNITVKNTSPKIFLTDTNADSDYSVHVENGTFHIRDESNSENRIRIESDGTIQLKGDVDVTGVSTFAGNINANGNIVGDDSTNISGINSVTATEYYGTGAIGSNLFRQDAQCNLLAGCNTGIAITTGENNANQNVLLGRQVGRRMICGCDNVLIGNNILTRPHRGRRNVMLGHNVGSSFTTTAQVHTNVFIGRYTAASQQANVSNSIAIGICAARCGTSNSSIIMGVQAGMGIQGQTHTANIFLGSNAGTSVSTGENNIVMGTNAGRCLCKGSGNLFLGSNAGKCEFRGGNNIGLGAGALCGINSGQMVAGKRDHNIALGTNAGAGVSSGDTNVFIGCFAGNCIISGSSNVAIGLAALKSATTPGHNIAIGAAAQNVTTGVHNIALGYQPLHCTTDGGCNFAFGNRALHQMTSGSFNVVMGGCAGRYMTSGCRNIFLGDQAACCFISGSCNIAIGCRIEVPLVTGSNQLAIGNRCCYWLTGDSSYNVGIGSTTPQDRLDVGGTLRANGLNVSGVSTFAGITTVTGETLFTKQLSVSGVSTFADDITVQKNMHFGDSPTGTENLLSFGAGDDLSIFHSGNGSFIRDSGTGSLTLLTNQFLVRNAGNNEEIIEGFENSSVSLFFNGIKRLSTTGIGASVLGQLEVNNGINVTSGVSTFTGNIDANGTLDVDGHTELDNVNITGVTTFSEDVTFDGATAGRDIIFDRSANTLQVKPNAILKIGQGSYSADISTDGSNLNIDHNPISAIFVNTNDLQIAGSGTRGGVAYDGTIFRARTGVVELGHEVGNGGATGFKLSTVGYGVTVFGTTETQKLNVTGISTFEGNIDANGTLDVDGDTQLDDLNVAGVATFSSLVDVNNRLDVVGGANIDQLNVAGVSTFAGIATFTGSNLFAKGFSIAGVGTIVRASGASLTIESKDTTTTRLKLKNSQRAFSLEAINGGTFQIRDGSINSERLTIGSGGLVTILNSLNINKNLDVDGDTQLDDLNVAGVSTFSALVDIDAGGQANSFKVEDLTNNRLVIAGTGGELEDSSKVTFDGSTLAVVGDASFTGNVTIGGTLIKEDITNIDSIGIVTAGRGVRVTAGGLVVSSGLGTFSDSAYFPDNSKIKFGDATTADLEIYHSGAHSFISDQGTGSLKLLTSTLQVKNAGDSATMITAVPGSTGSTKLYQNNNERLATTREGVLVSGGTTTGTLSVTGVSTFAGQVNVNSDLYLINDIVHSGSATKIKFETNRIDFEPGATISAFINTSGITAIGADINGDLDVDGHTNLDNVSVAGVTTFAGNINANGNIVGDDSTNISGINTVAANFYFGCGGAGSRLFQNDSQGNLIAGTAAGLAITIGNSNQNNILIGRCAGKSINTSCFNVMIGQNAGLCLSGGSGQSTIIGRGAGAKLGAEGANPAGNTFLGFNAGANAISGNDNTFLGYQAGQGTSGCSNSGCNVAIGWRAGCLIKGGSNNIFVGRLSGAANSTGTENTFIGNYSGRLNITGGANIAIGKEAMRCNLSGGNNISLGKYAGKCATTATSNIAIGLNAGCVGFGNNSYNVAIGYHAGRCASGNATQNTLVGTNAGPNLTEGFNTFLGPSVATAATAAKCNVSIGYLSGSGLSCGHCNVFVGQCAGAGWKTGQSNISIGARSGPLAGGNGTGFCNIILGQCNADCITSGDSNVIIGPFAGKKLTTGSCNTLIGRAASMGVTSGSQNVFIGSNNAGPQVEGFSGTYNLGITFGAMRGAIGNAAGNVALGYYAGREICCAHHNVMIGSRAGCCSKTGSRNVFIGCSAGVGNTTGHCNVYIGQQSGPQTCGATGCYNTAIGLRSGCSITTGNKNIAIGFEAGICNTTNFSTITIGTNAGRCNVAQNLIAIGSGAGCKGASGSNHNTFIGNGAGAETTTGANNSFFGRSAGKNNTEGDNNLYLGLSASCGATTGSDNVALGKFAGPTTGDGTGDKNISIGLYSGNALSSGFMNIFIGRCAGRITTTGSDNIFLGRDSGETNTEGKFNIAIGADVHLPSATGECQLAIGRNTNRWIVGDNSFNVCVAGSAVTMTSGTTSCVIAHKFCGDGSCLTGIGTQTNLGSFDNLVVSGIATFHHDVGVSGTLTASKYGGDTDRNIIMGRCTGIAITDTSTSACFNVIIGDNNAPKVIEADDNVILGRNILTKSHNGCANIMMGLQVAAHIPTECTASGNILLGKYVACCVSTSLSSNVAIGNEASRCGIPNSAVIIGANAGKGKATCLHYSNVLIGSNAGTAVSTASYNTAIGSGAALCLCSGCFNVIIGQEAGRDSVKGDHNVAIGCMAMRAFGSGNVQSQPSHNVVIGRQAGYALSTTSHSVFLGNGAAKGLISGNSNIAIINGAMTCSVTASHTIAMGGSAGRCITSGDSNIAIGFLAGCNIGSCNCNIFIGRYAGQMGGSNNNIAIGCKAGRCIGGAQGGADSISRGGSNIMFGVAAGERTTQGVSLIYIGSLSGQCNRTGTCTIAIGRGAGLGDTNGHANVYIGNHAGGQTCGGTSCCNIAIGYAAGQCIFTGVQNIFLGGYQVGRFTYNGHCNIAFGRRAGYGNTSGSSNIYIGACSGPKTCGATGGCNIILGVLAGCDLTSGKHNIFMGQSAGNTITTGARNIAIGRDVELPSATGDDQLAIGCCTGRWVAGDSSFNVTLAGVSTAHSDGTLISKQLNVSGVSTFAGDLSIADKIVHTGDTNTFISFPAADQIVFEGGGHERFRINGTTGKFLFGMDITGRAANYNNTSVVPTIQIEDNTEASFSVAKFSNNTDSSRIYLQKGRGSAGSASVVQDNDTLGMIVFNGYNGSGFRNAAQILAEVDGTPTSSGDDSDMPGALVFKTSEDGTNVPAENLRITSTGRVGIGITIPTSKLHVTGDAIISGVVTATDFDATSDIRLKTNIQPIDDPIAKVVQIEGVSFNWKKDDRPALGVIADQVEKILPQLVHGDDPKTVNYNGLVGLLIEVVKDQQKQIDTLNERISKLE